MGPWAITVTIGIVRVAWRAAITTRVETHDYDVHVEPDEVGHELWQPLGPAIREAMVDHKVLPHPVSALSEPIFQSTNQREYILSRRYPRHIRRAPELEPTHRR